MPVVVKIPFDRPKDQMDSWARKYLTYIEGDDLGLSPMDQIIHMREVEKDPLVEVTLSKKGKYNFRSYIFTWATAADRTMFILKWS